MSKPITPQFYADTVVCQNITINYNPTWNGTEWVLDPTSIVVFGKGILSENGNGVVPADLRETADQLPPAGQEALENLLDFFEQQMSAKYSET